MLVLRENEEMFGDFFCYFLGNEKTLSVVCKNVIYNIFNTVKIKKLYFIVNKIITKLFDTREGKKKKREYSRRKEKVKKKNCF